MQSNTEAHCSDVIERTLQQWLRNLTDSSSKKKLLHYQSQSRDTIKFTEYKHQALNRLLARDRVPLTELSPLLEVSEAAERLDTIRQRALKNKEEQGLHTLFLALGIASWTVADEQRPPSTPVLLIPVTMDDRNQLQQTGEVQINPALLQVLEAELLCSVKADILLGDFEEAATPDPTQLLSRLEVTASRIPGFAIKPEAVLGHFHFHKMAVVEDLKAHRQVLATNPIIGILAGVREQTKPNFKHLSADPLSLEEFLVLQADSSQKQVIQSVSRGQLLTVIQGPPGTGKSQTIANLLALLAAKGQRVLFVAQKRSALEAVQRNLQSVGLGHLCLDFHDVDSRHQMFQQFADSWDRVQHTPHVKPDTVQQQLINQAQSLTRLTHRLHDPSPRTGKSIYEMLAKLLHSSPEEQIPIHFASDELRQSQPELPSRVGQSMSAWLKLNLEESLQEQPPKAPFERTYESALKDVDWHALEYDMKAFRQLAEQQRQRAVERICDAYAQRVIATMDRHPEQEDKVKQEMKKKRHAALRPFLGDTFEVLSHLRPCWMMSPLSVSQHLDIRCQFDVVIFDEASQIRVEEAVPAILRSSQVVVAGDLSQLPPLDFISRRQRPESLLECLATAVESHWLQWHYRSHDERLIAFSNRTFYENRLITFPSAFKDSPISHLVVEQTLNQSPSKNRKAFYVEAVKQLQQCQGLLRPNGCLFIVTSSDQVKLLKHLLASNLDAIHGYSSKAFPVKNLQSVQGDEADVIIWMLGYGKNRSGELRHNFGPLLLEGGERLLNVATTRARQKMWVVSSFGPHELEPEKCANPRGPEFLKQYLESIQQAPEKDKVLKASEVDLDDFELDVFKALTARGLHLEPLVGVSQAQIRLAAVHPNRPDRLVLAIDTDGPHNRALLDIQDRYLLWPEQLEARGFRVHRLWSIDWYLNREHAIARVLQAFEEAVAFADASDATSLTRGASTEPTRKSGKQKTLHRDFRPSSLTRHRDDYSHKDWQKLIQWIESDGLRRTKNDLLGEMQHEVCSRKTSKQDEMLRDAITRYRSSNSYADTKSSASAEGTKKIFMDPIRINRHSGQPSSKKARAKSNNTSRKAASQRESLFPSKR